MKSNIDGYLFNEEIVNNLSPHDVSEQLFNDF